MQLKKISMVLSLTVGLASCITTSQSLDAGPRALLSQGLVAGEFGSGLDNAAKRKALDAEIEALTNGVPGSQTRWSAANGVSGIVVPAQSFEVSGRVCRRYNHTITIKGQLKSEDATACRNESGIWEPLQ